MTYIITHDELLKLHGKKVTCEISGKKILDAKICVEKNCIFICQNVKNGGYSNDMMGYKYAWCVSTSDDKYDHRRFDEKIKLIEDNMTLEEIKEQIAKLNEAVAKIEAEKEVENVFDKYGRLIEANKDDDFFYIIGDLGNISQSYCTKNYCIKNIRDGFFKDFKSAEFALKMEMRNNILRKHGAEFPNKSEQWCLTASDNIQGYNGLGTKEFFQQYFSTEELANSAIKELTENNLLKIEME